MDQTQTAEPQDTTQQTTAPEPDAFSLDENALASLSPEQRASLDPILDGWKKRATEEISRRESEVQEKYKPYAEKAEALDKLTQYQPFVQWWQDQAKTASQGATPQQKAAIQNTNPQDIATQQEWQEAIWEASNGNGSKLQNLQARMFATWATPAMQQMAEKQQVLETQLEIKDIFERHPDAKELDSIGMDPKDKDSVSLLEAAFEWAERNGKTLEQGYQLASRWRDTLKVGAKQEAMGMVQEKKGSVLASPSTSSTSTHVVEVEDMAELVRRNMEAQLDGNKDVKFVIRRK